MGQTNDWSRNDSPVFDNQGSPLPIQPASAEDDGPHTFDDQGAPLPLQPVTEPEGGSPIFDSVGAPLPINPGGGGEGGNPTFDGVGAPLPINPGGGGESGGFPDPDESGIDEGSPIDDMDKVLAPDEDEDRDD